MAPSVATLVTLGASRALWLRLAGLALALVSQVALARALGTEGFGQYSYIMGWAVLLGTVATLGFPMAVQRLAPTYLGAGELDRVRRLERHSFARVLSGAMAAAVVCFVALRISRAAPDGVATLVMGAAVVPLIAVVHLASGWLKALSKVRTALAPDLLLRPAALAIVATLFLWLGRRLEVRWVLMTVLAALAAILAVQIPALARELRSRQATAPEGGPRAPADERREWHQIAWPLFLVSGFTLLLKRTDVLMLGWWLEADAVAVYHASARVSELAGFVLTAVTVAAPPVFAALWAQGKTAELQSLLVRLARWIVVPSVMLAAGLLLAAGPLLGLFGPEFTRGIPVLSILVCGHLLSAAAGPVGFLLSMTGHQRQVAWSYGLSVLLNGALNWVGIHTLGLRGAALATATTIALWNLWLLVLARRELGLDSSILNQLRTLRSDS